MNYVGTARPIHDAKGKATGYTKYAGDLSLPNMAYLCMLHSKIPHGYVKAVHAEKALALPGVYGVYHCLNTTDRKYNRYRSNFDQSYLPNEECAFNDYVRFVGDKIGAVAACDQETAERAACLVEVEYEELPFSIGFDDTLAGKNCLEGETPVRDEYSLEVGKKQESTEGLIEVCSTMELPRLHHATMETHACIADYDPYSDMLTVYCPNQAVHGIRTVLADFLEMPESHVRVVKATMGGSFGAKQEWFLEPVTALVAKKLCRPVKLVYSRGEAMTDTIVRGAMRMSARGYYTPDGEMKEIYCDVTLDAGAYIGNAGDYVRALAGKPTRCYRIPYMHYHGQVISSNSPVSGAFRSWSAAEEALMMERQLDAAAEKLGMDRLAIRLKNVARSGEEDKKLHLSLEDIRIGDAITLGSEKFGWDKLKAEDAAFNASQQRYRRGVGIGIGGHGNTYFPRFNDYGEGSISLNADGSMQANFTLHDHGCGTVTAMRMIAAEVLKVPEDKIYMTEGDTAVTPIDYGCFASRTTYVVGRAVQDAANALRKKMLHAASELLDVPEDELFLNDSHICRAGQDEPLLSFAELAKKSMHTHAGNLTAYASYSNVTNPGVTGAHFAHVEVDTWTGFTKVLDYLAVHDIGQAINPGLCEAQIQGAVQMGCGAALREKMTMQKDGRCTESLSKYHLFLANDLPNIRVELLQDGRSKGGPFGAKSIGEVCYVPVAPAVCGAVNDALHANLSVLPYDPDCILKYLAEVREKHDA